MTNYLPAVVDRLVAASSVDFESFASQRIAAIVLRHSMMIAIGLAERCWLAAAAGFLVGFGQTLTVDVVVVAAVERPYFPANPTTVS